MIFVQNPMEFSSHGSEVAQDTYVHIHIHVVFTHDVQSKLIPAMNSNRD